MPPIGGERPAAPAGSEDELEAIIRFQQLKLELGWTSAELKLSPYLRRQRLEQRYSMGTSAQAAETAVTTARGFRCST